MLTSFRFVVCGCRTTGNENITILEFPNTVQLLCVLLNPHFQCNGFGLDFVFLFFLLKDSDCEALIDVAFTTCEVFKAAASMIIWTERLTRMSKL